MTPFTRDDFAAGGGWSQALLMLGLKETVGTEFDPTAVATARAAGHSRWLVDVRSDKCRGYAWPPIWLYIASPPCQTFAQSGSGDGLKHLGALKVALRNVAEGLLYPEDAIADVGDEKLDDRSVLALEPMLVITRHRPRNVVLEQVPPVLPLWEAYAELMREMGYSVWTGYLFSEQYGVPQARKRAVLMASFDREVAPPVPTHSKYHRRTPTRLDDGVKPWISMDEALGRPPIAAVPGDTSWTARRPSPTIVGSYRPDIVAAPGYRKAGDPPRQKTPGSVHVTAAEAGVLQSFPSDYPWQGDEAKQFEQIGNAVPPLMGAAVLAALLGLDAPA